MLGLISLSLVMIQKKNNPLPPLPGPVLQNVFRHLSIDDRVKCRQVCKLWNRVLIYGDHLPGFADFHVDCNIADAKISPLSRFISKLKANIICKFRSDTVSSIQYLQEFYEINSFQYFLRPQLHVRLIGFEMMPLSTTSGPFLHHSFLNIAQNITNLELESVFQDKLVRIKHAEFSMLLSCLPQLKRLSLPLKLLCDLHTEQFMTPKYKYFPKLRFLKVQLPETLKMYYRLSEHLEVFAKLAMLLGCHQFEGLQTLEIFSDPGENGKLSVKESVKFVNGFVAILLRKLQQNADYYEETIATSLLGLRNFTFSIHGFAAYAFDNGVIMKVFDHLAKRGLKTLNLKLEVTSLTPSLTTLLEIFENAGCDINLDLEFIITGSETEEDLSSTQAILKNPIAYKSIRSVEITTLAEYGNQFKEANFFHKLLPFKSEGGMEWAIYDKLTTLDLHFEKPISISLPFVLLEENVWPEMRHISITMGQSECKKTLLDFDFSNLVDQSMQNIAYLIFISKRFQKLKTLRFWANFKLIFDEVLQIWPGENGKSNLKEANRCVPFPSGLRKLSLRGFGPLVTNECLKAFYGMGQLTHLELLGSHYITNSGKVDLLKNTPSLKEIKFK